MEEYYNKQLSGSDNPADILTKHIPTDPLNNVLGRMDMKFLEGRSPATPEIQPEK